MGLAAKDRRTADNSTGLRARLVDRIGSARFSATFNHGTLTKCLTTHTQHFVSTTAEDEEDEEEEDEEDFTSAASADSGSQEANTLA